MKKVITLASAAYLLSSVSAYAGIIIEPTIITAPQPVIVEPAPVVYAPAYATPVYPERIDRDHHRYDWKYWHDRNEREAHEHHEHEEHHDHY